MYVYAELIFTDASGRSRFKQIHTKAEGTTEYSMKEHNAGRGWKVRAEEAIKRACTDFVWASQTNLIYKVKNVPFNIINHY